MPDTATTTTAAAPPPTAPHKGPTPTIRFGYHGSSAVATDIVRLAGWDARTVELSEYDVADPFRGIRAGELDLMIIKFGLREPDLVTSRLLAQDPRAVVVGADHPLAARESVSIEELADYDTFARPGTFPDYVWDEVVPPRTPAGRPVRRSQRVAAIPDMMRLVASGSAIHISLLSLADVAPPTIRVVPIHDLPPAPVTVAWRRGTELPAHLTRFITTAEATASR